MALTVIVGVIGASVDFAQRRVDARRYPPPGRLIAVEGHRLHLHCTGHRDGALVVIVPGAGGPSAMYEGARSDLAKTRRTCIYDRAGMAWSDAGPFPRTMPRQARELHLLLTAAGELPPYILVAHSFGGLIARRYAADYRRDLAGLVLADTSVEPDIYWMASNGNVADSVSQNLLGAWLAPVGMVQLVRRTGDPVSQMFDGAFRPQRDAIYASYTAHQLATQAAEWREFPAAADSILLDDLGNLPIVVLTADRPDPVDAPPAMRISHALSLLGQDRLAHLSQRSWHVLLRDSDHLVLQRRPDMVAAAIAWIAQGAPPRSPKDGQ